MQGPFDMARFVHRIEQEQGRRITLLPVPEHLLAAAEVSGLCLRYQEAALDVLVYRTGTPGYEARIILHELVHLWCSDLDGAESRPLEALLPDFPPALMRRMSALGGTRALARRRYDTRTEMRAETVANLLYYEAYAVETIEDDTLRHLTETLSYA